MDVHGVIHAYTVYYFDSQVWPEPVAVGAVVGCGLSSLLKLMGPAITTHSAGYKMYWPTKYFVHERHV